MKRFLKRAAIVLGLLALVVWGLVEATRREYVCCRTLTEAGALDPQPDPEAAALRDAIDAGRLVGDVARLASPELRGRANGTPGSARARALLVERMEELGLEPLFGGSWEQPVLDGAVRHGTNVGGVLKGATGARTVLLVAHYDHLGAVDGELHLGADDNASAVAILLEVARVLARDARAPHDVAFLFPDSEEPPDIRSERMGSSWFVRHPPFDLERLQLAIVLDLMGGAAIAGDPALFFALGAEGSERLAALVSRVPAAPRARCETMSVAMIEAIPYLPWYRMSKSDYHAFRRDGRPWLFLTAGPTPRYHTPRDLPDSLDYEKMVGEAAWLTDLVRRVAREAEPFAVVADRVDPHRDLALTRRLIDLVLAHPGEVAEATLAALRADRDTLEELQSVLDEDGVLDARSYRRLQLVGLRVQCALTRPGWGLCRGF